MLGIFPVESQDSTQNRWLSNKSLVNRGKMSKTTHSCTLTVAADLSCSQQLAKAMLPHQLPNKSACKGLPTRSLPSTECPTKDKTLRAPQAQGSILLGEMGEEWCTAYVAVLKMKCGSHGVMFAARGSEVSSADVGNWGWGWGVTASAINNKVRETGRRDEMKLNSMGVVLTD